MVHAAAVARQSDALNALVNGDMAEARLKRVVWDDIRVDTFVNFMQYIYQGYYSALNTECSWRGERKMVTGSDKEEEKGIDAAAKKNDDSEVWDLRRQCTQSELREFSSTFTRALSQFDYILPVKLNKRSEDFTPFLLCHARLYVLAEKYQIRRLKALSIYKLYHTLLDYRVYPERFCELIELIRYVYSDENTPDGDDPVDELRALVARYVNLTSVVRVIGTCPEFSALLEEGGAFVKSVWPLICAKLKLPFLFEEKERTVRYKNVYLKV